MNILNKKSTLLLVAIFFTGLSSLAYQLVWVRKLSLVFGTSALAISTVLAIFMTGLALGSLYGGKLIEKSKNPYRFLAWIELLIGISAIATLLLIDLSSYVYIPLLNLFGEVNLAFNLTLFLLYGLILLVPTFFIGAAFPTIIKLYYEQRQKVGGSVSIAYAADTIGSALGVLLVGFFSIWLIGFFKTALLASVINIVLSALIFFFSKGQISNNIEPPHSGKIPDNKFVLAIFFFSGMAALILENTWIRFFNLIYGNSIVSFSIVVATFLFGLGVGSWLAKYLIKYFKNKSFIFASIELIIGLSSLVTLLFFPYLEKIFLAIFFDVNNYTVFLFLLGLISVGTLIIPTILMGMTLPVLSTIYVNGKTIGADVGKLFSINSFGSIVGSFMAGFILFQLLGLNNTTILAALIYIVIAFIFIYVYDRTVIKKLTMIFSFSTVIIIALFIFFYQPNYLYNGVYYHGPRGNNSEEYFTKLKGYTTLFSKQSAYSYVSVVEFNDRIHVKINGRSEGSSFEATQNLLAHLPLLFHKNPKTVVNIGHGGGYTLNTITKYPGIETIDNIEIDKVIIEADQYVTDNGNPLDNDKVNLIVADGRNYLATTDKKYDIIITEPSHFWANPWFFTKEFYKIIQDSLSEDGIYSIWIPFYEMTNKDYTIILNTIRTAFPYTEQFYFPYGGDLIILASNYKIDLDKDFNETRTQAQAVASDLEIVKELLRTNDLSNKDALLEHHKDNAEVSEKLKEYEGTITTINTDDLPILEFNSIRNKYKKFRAGN